MPTDNLACGFKNISRAMVVRRHIAVGADRKVESENTGSNEGEKKSESGSAEQSSHFSFTPPFLSFAPVKE